MRTHILLWAFMLTLLACGERTDNKRNNDFQKREDAKKTSILSMEKQDTILLHYRFGMTEEEADQHLKCLIDSGIVFNFGHKHFFEFTGASTIETYKVYFYPIFHEGLLYKLMTIWKPEFEEFDASFHVMPIGSALKDKYNGEFFFYKDFFGQNEIVIYSKNLEIDVYVRDNEINVSFTDSHVKNIIDNKADSVGLKKQSKSKEYL